MEHDDPHPLVLTPVADRSWRLSDREVEPGDPAGLVAYVERLDTGAYQAVWVSVGWGSARFASLEDLLHTGAELLEQSRSLGAFKPAPIPHRPPEQA